MKFIINREELLKPLQYVSGIVEKRQTQPILSNCLLEVQGQRLVITVTDSEIEMVTSASIEEGSEGEITVPARKLIDICRALPEGQNLSFSLEEGRAILKTGRSRFVLATLPANEFPSTEQISIIQDLAISQKALKYCIQRTHFAMAQQDVRHYLRGLLLELNGNRLRCVSTDGHRLALCDREIGVSFDEPQQIILPRKAVNELIRLLADEEEVIRLQIDPNHLRIITETFQFTSKLVDGKFPDYERVLPQKTTNPIIADTATLKQALVRTSILSNERFRSVRLQLEPNKIRILANNPDQEEAEDEIEVSYGGDSFEAGFNANYILDALSAIEENQVDVELADPNSCCLIKGLDNSECKYVIMPMRI